VRRCEHCGEWVEKHLLFCPLCRLPLVPVEPTSHRPAALIAFGVVLTALVVILLLIVRYFIR
jgi:hypothetical protein